MKVNVVTLCSGYDSQALACERLKRNFPNFDYELIAWAEFDPDSKQPIEKQPAVVAHNALFPQWADRNMGDITTCDWSVIKEPIDLLCYSTPCQSISNAGLQHGFKEDSGTRSSIIWSVLNAIRTLRPKYLLMENVAAMVQSKFIKDFHEWQNAVASLGYTHYTDILNSKDFGVAQNRERVFMVSVRNDIGMRYHFPKPFKLEKRLKDVLEENVDEKYYLGDKALTYIAHRVSENDNGGGYCKINGNVSSTLTATGTQNWTGTFVSDPFNSQDGVSRTIKAQYANVGGANLIRDDAFGATGVIEYDKERDIRTIEEQGQERESSQPLSE